MMVRRISEEDLDIKSLKGITADSRQVKPGYLFAALKGAAANGEDYIDKAIQGGSNCILVSQDFSLPENLNNSDIQLIQNKNPRSLFAKLVAQYYALQPENMVAVTGTNGKTSVAHFVRQIWEGLELKAASLGTLGLQAQGFDHADSLTTPDPVSLHETLKELAENGVDHAVMEASSHGLDQYRLHGVRLKAAGFTNLSRDHLDYHGDMQNYLAAKAKLFTEILEPEGWAVLNADADESRFIHAETQRRADGIQFLSFGKSGGDLKILEITPVADGQQIKCKIFGQDYDFKLPLVGEFQVWNVLCAVGLVIASGAREKISEILEILKTIQPVPGRLQNIAGHPKNAGIYVDYAHTPDALETVLKAVRPHCTGKLICIMGCGGDRDKGKRPLMGTAACEYADSVIVTDDNPRSEDPAQIRAETLKGCPGAQDIGDRRAAIQAGIEMLDTGDVLVIAGKGHEQGQIFKDRTEPFDDAAVAREILQTLNGEKLS